MAPIERPHRLDRQLYQGRILCCFTCCVQNCANLFDDAAVVRLFEDQLLASLQKNRVGAHVYLFMPDHLHMLLEGLDDDANVWKAVVDFKQQTGFWLTRLIRKERWQKDFYDHVLRKDEDVLKQVAYILANPVRAEIVDDWKQYPYKGSTVYDLTKLEL